jgi:hypothetical protein
MGKRIKLLGSKLSHIITTKLIALEKKWALIKYDAFKFCGDYSTMVTLNESGTANEDRL